VARRDANEAYDPATDTWRTLQPLPHALNHVCAVGLHDTLYILGGFDPSAGNYPVDSTYAYDPATDTWSPRAPMPTPRGALAPVRPAIRARPKPTTRPTPGSRTWRPCRPSASTSRPPWSTGAST
jgi:N-acetylneuraminic acid mutarotase